MEEKLRFHLGDQTGSLGGSSWIRSGQTDKHVATEAGERVVDAGSLPPASPPGALPWRPFGLGDREDDGRWRRGRMAPKGGVPGAGPGAGLCADG